MKEIGIEKLIELLNEFEEYNKNCEFDEVYNYYPYRVWYEGDFETDLTENCMNIVFIMSKTFGFIKWLVENDKIDTDAYKTVYSGDLDKRKTLTMSSGGDEFYQVTEHGVYESLLMLLAISDTPIEDLISYLK